MRAVQDRSALLEQQVGNLQDQLVAAQHKCAALEEDLRRGQEAGDNHPDRTWTPGHSDVTVTELHTTCQVRMLLWQREYSSVSDLAATQIKASATRACTRSCEAWKPARLT